MGILLKLRKLVTFAGTVFGLGVGASIGHTYLTEEEPIYSFNDYLFHFFDGKGFILLLAFIFSYSYMKRPQYLRKY